MSQRCECVFCHVCRGQGKIYIEDRMGLGFGDFEECWNCWGSGIEEMCDWCEIRRDDIDRQAAGEKG